MNVIPDLGFTTHPPGTRDACPTIENRNDNLVGQPSWLPGGWVATQTSKLKTQNWETVLVQR